MKKVSILHLRFRFSFHFIVLMSIACESDSCLIQKGSNMSSTAITFIIVPKDYKTYETV